MFEIRVLDLETQVFILFLELFSIHSLETFPHPRGIPITGSMVYIAYSGELSDEIGHVKPGSFLHFQKGNKRILLVKTK